MVISGRAILQLKFGALFRGSITADQQRNSWAAKMEQNSTPASPQRAESGDSRGEGSYTARGTISLPYHPSVHSSFPRRPKG